MNWLKSLVTKPLQKLARLVFAPFARLGLFSFKWNQTTKALAGVSASIFSMMALLSFFSSLEEPAARNDAESIAPELGASDELSMEFGLDAALPLDEPGLESSSPDKFENAAPSTPVIQTVSVEQTGGTIQDQGGVYHAVGQRDSAERVVQVAGEYPIYVSRDQRAKPAGSATSDSSAAWLTGEIEEIENPPAQNRYRQFRN